MKVLLISPNIEFLPDPVFPLGLAYITAALKKNNIPYRILDLCFVSDYDAAIESSITTFKPDIIGLSLRNVDNVSYPNSVWYLPFYQKVTHTIRRFTLAPIVLGGSGFALIPEKILAYLNADFGIIGEGEASFVELINLLKEKDKRVTDYRSKRIFDGKNKIRDFNTLPRPDRSGFDNTAYLKKGGMGNIQTKRGCPFKCIYCTYPVIEGGRVRQRHPTHVCDEIENILESGIDTLFFVDNTFNYPAEHALAVCREMIQRQLPIKWSCYAHPKFITAELIDLMLASGCSGVEFGSDAAVDGMLINMGKNFTVNDLKRASTICRRSGIAFCHSLLLGGPGETMETVQRTLAEIRDMSPTTAIAMIGIRVFPRTRLAKVALKDGMIGPNEDFLKPVFYISQAIQEEIIPFIKDFSKANHAWIFPGLNINMTDAGQRAMRRFGIKGPLWEFMKRIDKAVRT